MPSSFGSPPGPDQYSYSRPAHLAADQAVQRSARDNTEEQFSESIKKDDVAGAIFERQECNGVVLKKFTEDANFASEAMKHIRAETYKTARSSVI